MKYKQVRKYYGRGRRGYYRVKPQITVSTKDAKCMVGLALLPLAFLASCAKVEPKKQKEKIVIDEDDYKFKLDKLDTELHKLHTKEANTKTISKKEKNEIRDAIIFILVFAAIIVGWVYCLTL